MKVYRVEKNGHGPYTERWDGRGNLLFTHNNNAIDTHPGINTSGCFPDWFMDEEYYPHDWRSACPTLEDLRQWFEGFLEDMLAHGFSIVEYEAKHVQTSLRGIPQVLYRHDTIDSRKVVM